MVRQNSRLVMGEKILMLLKRLLVGESESLYLIAKLKIISINLLTTINLLNLMAFVSRLPSTGFR